MLSSSDRFANMNAGRPQPLKVVFVVGVGLGDRCAWPGDVLEIEAKLARALCQQGRAKLAEPEVVERIRREVAEREARGEVVRG